MQVRFQPGKYSEIVCDLLAFPIFENETPDSTSLRSLDKLTGGLPSAILSSGELKPELHRTCLIHHPSGLKAQRLLLVGGGKQSEFNLARLREVAGTTMRSARNHQSRSVALYIRDALPGTEALRVSVEGALYGNYEPDVYKTRDKEEKDVEELILTGETKIQASEVERAIQRGTTVGDATNLARALVNEPANVLTPTQFAKRAVAVGTPLGLEVQILEREQMEKLGMNLLLAVSQGSEEPPKLILLAIKDQMPKRKKGRPLYALIGKGVTFDAGGLSIKPGEKMEEMKADMAGGAAVLGAMAALAQLRPRHNVMGLIPAVENLPSGRSTRPGDVVKSYHGKTVEIISTDAEGRLLLADTLAYARFLGATNLIDVATLTGACAIALGTVNAGIMGTDQKTIDRLAKNWSITGEKLWQLPLDDEYRKAIRSEIADIKNVGNRYGGAITAAKFLQEFVEDTPWVHLDIAGVDLDTDGRPFAAKGATGFGVRTLVQLFLRDLR